MLKFVLLLIIFSQTIFGKELYVARNKNEQTTLEDFRKEEIKIGVLKNYFTDTKIDGVSLDDILEDMLKNYLQLNIKREEGSWDEIYSKFNEGEIDALNFSTQTNERKKLAYFTDPLFGENLYVASQNKKINSKDALNNSVIYLTKGSIYEYYLDIFIKNNDFKIEKKYNRDNLNFKDEYHLDSEYNVIDTENKIEIGRLPDISMVFSKKYKNLIPIINNALNDKYKKVINDWFTTKKIRIFQKNFYKDLNPEELAYLENLKNIGIIYEETGSLSYYSTKTKRYEGVVPDFLSIVFEGMGVKLIDKSIVNEEWHQKFSKFEKGDIDIIPMSKSSEREKNYIFTKKLFDLSVYKLECFKQTNEKKIGVTKNGIEENVARRYFLDDEIVTYTDRGKMIKDLKNHKISSMITFDLNDLDKMKYTIESLEIVPVNLALKKENYILRDIIDKAIDKVVDKKEILKKSELQNRNYVLEILDKKNMKYNNILSVLIFVLVVLVFQSYKIIMQKKKNRELLKDSLTGLLSRGVFEEFCLNKNYLSGVAIIIDLNKFKIINDSYGHEVGDEVLIAVSNCLKAVFKKDYIFRISGDEFYIFASKECIQNKFKDIETVFRNTPILNKNNIGFSLGYYIKEKNIKIKDSFRYADIAMYNAKKSKSYKIKEADQDFINQTNRKEKIKEYLKTSIEKEFYPAFQPKFELSTGQLSGAETLARWENKELGFISPGEFIPLAEDIGIIHEIDYKMAEETIKYLKEYLGKNSIKSEFRISFNLSAETFKRNDIVEKIGSYLEKYQVSGKNIEVEITESMILADLNDVIKKLNLLKGMGIKISIDDFTAGHSTVGLLTTLPIDIVKFDRSLILALKDDIQKGKAIYLALTKMIKSLEFRIVSEGIEEEYELEFLKSIGVDYGQGYLLGKPGKGL
ncbi:MAG: EAL domain-containing protein [Cetobacterium sp.]|uniref:EAL domain-containing protein n=5 Tax=Cetobacterium sp. TaxID=2071632 RepID=UPI002FC6A908